LVRSLEWPPIIIRSLHAVFRTKSNADASARSAWLSAHCTMSFRSTIDCLWYGQSRHSSSVHKPLSLVPRYFRIVLEKRTSKERLKESCSRCQHDWIRRVVNLRDSRQQQPQEHWSRRFDCKSKNRPKRFDHDELRDDSFRAIAWVNDSFGINYEDQLRFKGLSKRPANFLAPFFVWTIGTWYSNVKGECPSNRLQRNKRLNIRRMCRDSEVEVPP
jgi:hypothetical protein